MSVRFPTIHDINVSAALRNYHLNPRLGAVLACAVTFSQRKTRMRALDGFGQPCLRRACVRRICVCLVLQRAQSSAFFADYSTISGVNGPLVILDNVKVRILPPENLVLVSWASCLRTSTRLSVCCHAGAPIC